MSTSSSDSENESSQAGPSRQLAPSSDENDDNLTTEQVEKLVQLQDLTGIEDTSICRALLESKNWDLEATAREQFGERDPPTTKRPSSGRDFSVNLQWDPSTPDHLLRQLIQGGKEEPLPIS